MFGKLHLLGTRRDFLLAASISALVPTLAGRARAVEPPPDLNAAATDLDVRSCGALGNGRDIDTAAINTAIETVAAKGGGTVRFPAGEYLTHTLHLKDGITLYLERDAVLRAAPAGLYDPIEPNRWEQYQDYGHDHWHNSMILGIGVKNVAIAGAGLICGDGLNRGDWFSVPHAIRGGADKIIALKECRNVKLSGVSVVGSAHIAILATGVTDLQVSRVLVDVGRDGVDIDCCENVTVEDSWFNTPHDDSIVLKSSDALGHCRPTANVHIRRCFVTGGFRPGTFFDGSRVLVDAEAGMKARIKIGTESCWGFDGVRVESCTVWNALGIPLLTVDGGYLKDVALRDIAMRNIQDAPLFLRLGARLRAPAGATVQPFAGVAAENIICDGFRMPLTISGIPGHRITDVALRNIELIERRHEAGGDAGGWLPLAERLALANTAPPEKPSAYPEPGMFGPLPARLLFARHVERLGIDGLRLKAPAVEPAAATSSRTPDRRPLFWLQDVQGGRYSNINVPQDAAETVCFSDNACSLSIAKGDLAHPG